MVVDAAPSVPIERHFDPYTDNGGTTVAVAGVDFCVVAADTRMSEGYSINARYVPKAYKLSDSAVLATAGFHADGVALVKEIGTRMEWYKHQHEKTMSAPAIAQMLATMLYQRRFFPYYVFNLLGGLDENGRGAVFSYDPVGSYEREVFRANGSAASLIQPFLDNQVGFKNQANATRRVLSKEEVSKIVKDAFTSATERDIHTGDFLEIWTITKEGVTLEKYPLKKD